MTTQRIRYDVTHHIADIMLDRPPVNALDIGLAEALLQALRQAGNDPDVRAVVLSSHSDTMFCAGLDLKAAQTWSSPEVKQSVGMRLCKLMITGIASRLAK